MIFANVDVAGFGTRKRKEEMKRTKLLKQFRPTTGAECSEKSGELLRCLVRPDLAN